MVTTAGEGATATAYEGGGVGGKFRKRSLRKSQTTPYERPPTAFRNSSWLSKLVVDPATKLISAGAQRLFSSVFRKRLAPPPPPPPQPPEANQDSRNGLEETVPDNHVGPQEPADVVGGNRTCNNDTSGISELEQLLKQKSFTKSEIGRLTELLHSRAVDLSVKDDGTISGVNLPIQNNFSKPMPDTQKHQEFPIPLEGNKTETGRAYGAVSTPTVSKTLLEDEIASPAELAKAYMGSRPSKVSPSKLGMRSPVAREDAILLNNSPFTSNSPITLLALKTTGHVGIPGNSFTTPRSRGRSAIYNMARTPYSRVHPSPVQKVSGSRNYDYAGPSSSASQSVWENGGLIAFKPAALKRRSSVLDDDIGSVGPIRRIRQKANLSSQGTSLPSRGKSLGSDASQLHKLPLMDQRVSNAPSTNYAHIPRESSEMAARIFEQLEKMTPKEKSSESKLAAAREVSSLTPNMLRGQTLSSMEDLDASKLLQNSQNDHKLGNQPISSPLHPRDSATQSQGKVEENGFAKSVYQHDKLAPVGNSDTNFPVKDMKLSTKVSALPKFTPQSSERKRAFKMSAHEDYLELDDDLPSNKRAFKSAEGIGLEKPTMDSKSIASEGALDTTPVLSEVRKHPVPLSLKTTEFDTSNAPIAGEEHYGITFSSSHASTKATVASDSPLFMSFGSKSTGSVPFSTESKAERSSSLVNGSTLDTSDTKRSQLLNGTANGQLGRLPSLSSESTSTISVFSAGAPSSNLFLNSGLVAEPTHSNTETTDLKINAGEENGFDKFSKSSLGSMPFAAASSGSSNFGLNTFVSSAAANSQFQGSLGASGSAVSTQPSPAESGIATVSQSKPIQFGSSSSPTVFSASGITSFTSGSIFGSSAPAIKVAVSEATSTQSSLVTTSPPNVVNSSSSGSPTIFNCGLGSTEMNAISSSSTVTGTTKFAGGSSGANAIISSSGVTPSFSSVRASSSASSSAISSSSTTGIFSFSASSAVSSSPANAVTSSSTTAPIFSFGASNPGSSSEVVAFSSTGVNSSTIGSSWQASKSPVLGSTMGTLSPSNGFSFGASSSSSFGTTNSSPMGFGSTTGASSSPIFSFSAVSATTSLPSSSTQTLFGNSASPFAASTGSNDRMSTEDNMAEDRMQSPTPAAPVFGQSPVSPSPHGFVFGSTVPSPAAPFQFGGQPNQAAPQTPSQFQPSGSLGLNVGGGFSLGSGAPDKSGSARRIIKPNRNRNKKR